MRLAIAGILCLFSATNAFAQGHIDEATLRAAAAKPFGLVQKSQDVFYKKDGCISCHHQILPILAESTARERGIPFDAKFAAEVTTKVFSQFKDLDTIVQGQFYIDDIGDAWELIAAHAAGVPPSATTSAMAQMLASAQRADGGWRTMDARPPQSHGRFTVTAIGARAVSLYLPESLKNEKQAVVTRSREWLLKATPRTTEDRTYQLLGLFWTGADEAARKQAAQHLLALQRDDGGWSQRSDSKSDAYSTGEVLYALNAAGGVATDAPAYQRGLRYLLKSQGQDGSWFVESRLQTSVPVSPPYFNAGFPHGRRHQFLSIMGTSWASMALMQAIPPAAKAPAKPALPDFAPAEKDAWINIALTGSAADMKASLEKGMKANARTAKGTTALMLAARDPEKVKLLLKHGADVNARAESGFTALMVASRYRGNAETVRLLIEQGAKVNADKGVKVVNNASALSFASFSGDVDVARALIDAGANVNHMMIVLGQLPVTPIMGATLRGDVAMAGYLIERKADVNMGGIGTPLGRAVVNNQADVARLLLAKGAKVDLVDPLGMTPLHYAATAPHGDTSIVEALLAAGADRNAKDKEGRTALELARGYNHAAVAKALESKTR
jgi:ankyrin repeat protein